MATAFPIARKRNLIFAMRPSAKSPLRAALLLLAAATTASGEPTACWVPHDDPQATAALPSILALKRTSLKTRNSSNAPDWAESLALAHLASLQEQKKPLLPLLVQRLDPATFSPELQTALSTRYPADDWRGVLGISLQLPPPQDPPPSKTEPKSQP